ncbi:Endoribonuclease L-PSP [Planctomycetales bacterium 10988]|nr:Endoribonuclease L-PSP [Planctomycetales bacterium 10988]
MKIEEKLASLGLQLPPPPKPVAAYIPCLRSGNTLLVSGQLPFAEGKLLAIGKVPTDSSLETVQLAARQCVLNALSIAKDACQDDLAKIKAVLRLGVFVQSADDFYDQPQVANGASEFLQELLGEAGRHTRAAVGVNALPLNASVEIEFLFELHPEESEK